ncbi:MAG: Serine/threonine protein kinase PrkC, regulator of stationary phase, partial [Myxococcaceae bacterium]|nr:Serine/threonine protein kinase PrkC, regulator of stationary phase [Myxococcaceae bacterium]
MSAPPGGEDPGSARASLVSGVDVLNDGSDEGGGDDMLSAVAEPKEMVIGGRYRVIRALATGGMGTVYEAENLRTRRRVAIKTIRPEVAQRVSVVQRFEREAQAAGPLQHPNIVDVLDLGDDPEHQLLFIVQEFLVGGDLARCLRSVGTIAPRTALATLLPIMDALTLAHAHGVVHRDLKPDNIFLHETPQGVIPKLIDFGVAKFTTGLSESRSGPTSSLVGSPVYMSPEQARADATIDARTDVWSMGVVFYEALTGRTPFEGVSPFALFARIAADDPVTLASLDPELPADLTAAIQRAVTKDRDARWPTMADFAAALRACELWRGVDPAQAARWVVDAAGESRDSGVTPVEIGERTTLDVSDPGPAITVESDRHGSGLWTGELSPETIAPAPHRARWSLVVGVAAVVAAVGVGVLRTRGEPGARNDVAPVHTVVSSPPSPSPSPAVTEPAVAEPAVAEPVPSVDPVPAVAVAADAGAPPVHAPVRRVVR